MDQSDRDVEALPVADTQMQLIPDLFAAIPANASDLYLKLCNPDEYPRGKIVREHCERLWCTYHAYADPQFIAEFPVRFHQRWFEMYLTVMLLEDGANVQRTSPPGPDVLVDVRGRRVWIEAVCGTGGEPGLPDSVVEPPQSKPGEPHQGFFVPWDKIALRIRSSVEEKKRKYDKYLLEGRVATTDSLLIALNVYQIPYASSDVERYIFRSLYGIGNQVLLIDRKTAKAVGSTHEQLLTIPKLSSGALVGTQPFIDGSMAPLAGVLVSGYSAMSAAHKSSPDFALYPNLTATTPWKVGNLPIEREWQFQQDTDGWTGQLLTRNHASLGCGP
jgi:hypothetical protein